jgi:hypothetical protein
MMKTLKNVDQTLATDLLRYAELSLQSKRSEFGQGSSLNVGAAHYAAVEKEMKEIITRTGLNEQEIMEMVQKNLVQDDHE